MENKRTIPNLQCYRKYSYFQKNKKIKKDINFGDIAYYSFKSRRSQSLSTNYEDRKDIETKDIIPLNKNVNYKSSIKSFLNNNNIKERNINENIEKNVNKVKQLDDKISFKDVKIKNNCIKVLYKETLNKYPPIIPELFNLYILSNNKINNCDNKKYYAKLNYNKIPNSFYNHLMIKNKKNNNIYFSYSITKRIKAKSLTIIFYTPVKN